jgi:6-phosphogluconate dehydrogenase
MAKPASELGIIGMGVMGRSLALNLACKGRRISVASTRPEEVVDFSVDPRALGLPITYSKRSADFVASLKRPRKIWLMLKAGDVTDKIVADLLPRLRRGDVILEGGNSYFRDTERREALARKRGIGYLGCGVSGGEEGALNGPSLMAGGQKEAWELFAPLLRLAAAKDMDHEACAAWLGLGFAGHYVKMVHNGIEYALMQALAEVWQVLDQGFGLKPDQAAAVFESWKDSDLDSYLLEITARVLRHRDDGGGFLIEKILDRAGQKGTGGWAAREAITLGVPVPSLVSAVEMRSLSALVEERQRLGSQRSPVKSLSRLVAQRILFPQLRAWLELAQIAAFSQGMHLLHSASAEYGLRLRLKEVLRVWSGGCIIRSRLLQRLGGLYIESEAPVNPLFVPAFFKLTAIHLKDVEQAEASLANSGMPLPTLRASLDYVLALSSPRLPTSLIQAQRDCFGAHRFERLDKKGSFHALW